MGHIKRFLSMVDESRLLAPNLKHMRMHVYSNTAKPNRTAREVVTNHLLALRWMNPAAVVELRETRGPGAPRVDYTLHDGTVHGFEITSRHKPDEVVAKVLMAARDTSEDGAAGTVVE